MLFPDPGSSRSQEALPQLPDLSRATYGDPSLPGLSKRFLPAEGSRGKRCDIWMILAINPQPSFVKIGVEGRSRQYLEGAAGCCGKRNRI